jgi:hypothetical protein
LFFVPFILKGLFSVQCGYIPAYGRQFLAKIGVRPSAVLFVVLHRSAFPPSVGKATCSQRAELFSNKGDI